MKGRRWLVPGAPFLVSLALSAATLGGTVGWQDSGFFLTCVHEGALLHPPGFVLWELLCRLWTSALFFVPFTTAVHLFSAVCAAGAAAALALAARERLPESPTADASAAAAGCLAASGYTFWSAALLAKVYAFYYLVLAALLWRILRARATRAPRDFTIVAALIGLAWQAHPSATLAGPALIAFVALHAKELGTSGVAWRTLLAAALAAGPSLAAYPLLAGRGSLASFGHPDSLSEALAYLSGARFVGRSESFGLELSRLAGTARYAWEEFLGVGALLAVAGAVRADRRDLAAAALWIAPVAAVTVAFTVEGQHDFWLVAAWMPLHLLAAGGLDALGRRAGGKALWTTAAAGLAWAVVANGPDVTMRGYGVAETYGRLHLERLPERAVLVAGSDDVSGACQYLGAVKGLRPDVTLVRWSRLGDGWYDRRLVELNPELAMPDYAATAGRPGGSLTAFANANAFRGRPLVFEHRPNESLLRPDAELVEWGPLWILARKGEGKPDPKAWEGLPRAEDVPALFRRARGQDVRVGKDGRLETRAEPYERRLLLLLLRARVHLAAVRMRERTPEALREAAGLLESILRLDPAGLEAPVVLVRYGTALYALGRDAGAATAFQEALGLELPARDRAEAFVYLALLARKKGDEAGAERLGRQAVETPGLDAATKREMESRLRP
ncbi:MAG TPA: DUF2723 domain-containing protein [Planctomycetota bacterium]